MQSTKQNAAQELPVSLFDLHCDSIGECFARQQGLYSNNLQLSISKGNGLYRWAQCYAIWIPEEYEGAQALQYYRDVRNCFFAQCLVNKGKMRQCRDSARIESSLAEGKQAAILTIENASCANGSIETLEEFAEDGVKLITLTWNGINEIGCGALSGEESGLTSSGKRFVQAMGAKKIAADVSHLNRAGFVDVANLTETQMLASHSNAAAVFPHPRSLDDEQIRVLIQRRGLMGLCFCKQFLGKNENCGRQAFLRQLYHVLNLGGEHILAIGSDFDGAEMHSELTGVESILSLYVYLLQNGIPKETLNCVFFENARAFFQRL